MNHIVRSEREEYFEQLCLAVDADEAHEQDAIECFETAREEAGFDAARWLDIALYYSLAVARGIVDLVEPEAREHSDISALIADSLDIANDDDDCERFAAVLRFALANGVAVDLPLVQDGCQRALDDLENWASEDAMAPLRQLQEQLRELQRDGF